MSNGINFREVFRARIAELEQDLAYFPSTVRSLAETVTEREAEINQLRAELAAIKAQDTVGEVVGWYRLDRPYEMTSYPSVCATWHRLGAPVAPLYAAPVSEAKAQGEYGDAYQGAREDLAIWKRRALEAEEKVLQQERIITERLGNALNEENGSTFMGEPVFPAKAKGVVMPERMAAIPLVKGADLTAARYACDWYNRALDEVARLNAAPVQQVSVPDGWAIVPIVPTPEMLAATTASKHEGLRAEVMRMAAEDYCAMLNAALSAGKEKQDEHS